VSGDADDQPEKWRAALWRAGGWTHKGSAGAAADVVREGSTGGSSSGDDDRQLEHVVSMLGFGRFQEQSLLILMGMQLVDGMEATLWWSFEAVVRERWDVTNDEYRAGCCAAVLCLAAGSILGGRLADEYGRHFVLFFSGAVYLCAAFLSCFAFNAWCLVVLRCLCSAALGCRLPATMTLAVELLPCTWRARGAILLSGVGGTMGCVVMLLIWEMARWLAIDTMPHGWRLVFASCFVVDAAVFYQFRNKMAESPFFLRLKGRVLECRALITEIAEINDCVLPDDEVAISRRVGLEDDSQSEALRRALKRTGQTAVVIWVATSVCSAALISELVEDEGVVFNRVGSLGSVPHGFQMSLLCVVAAYSSIALLELPHAVCFSFGSVCSRFSRTTAYTQTHKTHTHTHTHTQGFRGGLLIILVPALMGSITVTLVPPSHGTAAYIAAV